MTGAGAVAGVIVRVCFSGPIARALRVAWNVPELMAAATLNFERWDAGARLMQSANTQGWAGLSAASDFDAAKPASGRCVPRGSCEGISARLWTSPPPSLPPPSLRRGADDADRSQALKHALSDALAPSAQEGKGVVHGRQ
jgi:hypothetical protein